MKRITSISRPGALRFTAAAIVVGIAAAYTPALGNGSTWSLPYTGSTSTTGTAFTVTNTGSGGAISATAPDAIYGLGTGTYGTGVIGFGTSNGVEGVGLGSTGATGVWGATESGASGYGVVGVNGAAAVYGWNSIAGAIGVQGSVPGSGTGVYGSGEIGVAGVANTAYGAGVQGYTSVSTAIGLTGGGTNGAQGLMATSDSGYGAEGESNSSVGVFGSGAIGVYGNANGNGQNLAGDFNGSVFIAGNLQVTGTINKSAVGFKIDHPLDPAHKFLMHSCVESNEMMNIYRGNVVLDSDGKATVVMPDWFQAENTEFSYQLTAIGKPAPGLYVSREIEKNEFEVAGGTPEMKISWQVTGARNDKYAIAHPLKIEVDKPAAEQGKYIRPEEYGQPQSKMIGYINAPVNASGRRRAMPNHPAPVAPVVPHQPNGGASRMLAVH